MTTTLKRTIAFCMLLGLPAVAFAQSTAPVDLNSTSNAVNPSTPAPSQAPSIARQWRGFYVGGFIGSAHGESNLTTTTVAAATGYLPQFSPAGVQAIVTAGNQSLDTSETEYGGFAGYNIRVGRVIIGGEGDYSSMRLSGTVTSGDTYPCCAPSSFVIRQSIDANWLATLRLRGGYTFGRTLVFGTFGMAWTDLNYESEFTDTAGAHEDGGLNGVQSSSVWGAGVEFWLLRNLSVKGEYMATDFEPASTTSSNLTQGGVSYPLNQFTHQGSLKVRVYRGGVIIRF